MNAWLGDLKVFSPGYLATEWGFGFDQIVDLPTALAQPQRVAVMPVFYSLPHKAEYRPEFMCFDLSQFDLVLFTDIEWHSKTELMDWIATTGVKDWLLHVAGVWLDEPEHPRVMYRPAWSFNFMRWNPPRDCFPLQRPFAFECMLGARRVHRDFAMLSLQSSGLLERGIVTYRDLFVGHWIDHTPEYIAQLFPDQHIQYPYVSVNLDPDWEVKPALDPSVSGLVPWDIYDRTYFSLVCETLATDVADRPVFLSAEKMGKCLYARRMFVVFAIAGFLQQYRDWGFETFGDVIDESYDSEQDDVQRWTRAFEQVKWLCSQDLSALIQHVKPRLDHNHHRLRQFEKEMSQRLQEFVADHLK